MIIFIFFISQCFYSQSTDEKKYLRKFIYPLQSYEPEIGFKEDSLVFDRFFSKTKVIGLGEASHGSSEIFKIKDKITRYIFQKNNGGVFSIEASMPNSFLLNEYLIKRNKTGKEYVMNIQSWIYQTEEILNMVEWMKKYNDKNEKKIQFTGFDMTTYTGSIIQLKILMDKYKIPLDYLSTLSKNIQDLNHLKLNQIAEKKRIKADALDEINHLSSVSLKVSDPEDLSWFLQHLVLIKQYINKTYDDRNRFMAENIFWLRNKYPESTFVLWAHNEHLKKTGKETGEFLREKFKDDYVNCGTFFYEGYHSTVDLNDKNIKPIYLEKTSENSLEELLNSFNIPIFIMDLQTIKKENNMLAKEILNKINYRTIGAAQHKKDVKSGRPPEDFDYLIFIKKTTASKLLTR